jgi:uncharacterized membrane protein YhaH (DUF805 family)
LTIAASGERASAALGDWVSPLGRVGRKGYWLHFMLPTFALALLGGALPLFDLSASLLSGGEVPLLGLASSWIFIVGNVKRVRDLKVSAGPAVAIMGVWVGVMAVAMVIAAGLFFFGLLAVMSNGGPDGEALMRTAAVVFFVPMAGALLAIGFLGSVPGETSREGHGPDPAADESASDLT